MKVLIVIPAYNEEFMMGKVLNSLPKYIKGIGKIATVVINDGSKDNTSKIAQECKAVVISHVLNRGLGASLATGFAFAKKQNADIMVTFDADGQHRAEDIPRVIDPIVCGEADIVIGSRLIGNTNMPISRRIINMLSNIMTFALFGIWTTDSQSGFRAFSKNAISKIYLRTQRMEVSSEIFKEIKRNRLSMREVAIPSIYTEYSLKKGQKITNAYNIFWKLILGLAR